MLFIIVEFSMQQFRIRKDTFKQMQRKILKKIVPLMIIPIVVVFWFQFSTIDGGNDSVYATYIPVLIVLGVTSYVLYKANKRNILLLESYVLTFDDECIAREMMDLPFIAIPKAEITEILKKQDGSFWIKGKSKADFIGVSYQIEEYDTVERLLSEIKPISVQGNKTFTEKFYWLIVLLPIASMIGVYAFKDKILVSLCGTIFVAFSIYSAYQIKTSKNVPLIVKKNLWLYILVYISVIGAVFLKLIAD